MTIKSEYVLTDNAGETLRLIWDGERFALIAHHTPGGHSITNTVILNPREASELAAFINSTEKGEKK